jgi:uncharacterized protein (TIGR02268 family)
LQSERARQGAPGGITGLLATGVMDQKGILARSVKLGASHPTRETFKVKAAIAYRACGRVAVELRVQNLDAQPWQPEEAVLVGQGGQRLLGTVWPHVPFLAGTEPQLLVAEADMVDEEAAGRFTLQVREAGGARVITLPNVAFP